MQQLETDISLWVFLFLMRSKLYLDYMLEYFSAVKHSFILRYFTHFYLFPIKFELISLIWQSVQVTVVEITVWTSRLQSKTTIWPAGGSSDKPNKKFRFHPKIVRKHKFADKHSRSSSLLQQQHGTRMLMAYSVCLMKAFPHV